MGTLEISDIPAATMSVLRRRARRAQRSVEEYVRDVLVEDASRRSLSDILDDADAADRSLPLDVHMRPDAHRMVHPE